jgi:hypothetical protein
VKAADSVRGRQTVCEGMQRQQTVREGGRRRARAADGMRGHARVCEMVDKFARVAERMQGQWTACDMEGGCARWHVVCEGGRWCARAAGGV